MYENWLKVLSQVDESLKRKLAAAKALDLGWGGISAVRKITGMSNTTIRKGIKSKTQKLSMNLRQFWMRIPLAIK